MCTFWLMTAAMVVLILTAAVALEKCKNSTGVTRRIEAVLGRIAVISCPDFESQDKIFWTDSGNKLIDATEYNETAAYYAIETVGVLVYRVVRSDDWFQCAIHKSDRDCVVTTRIDIVKIDCDTKVPVCKHNAICVQYGQYSATQTSDCECSGSYRGLLCQQEYTEKSRLGFAFYPLLVVSFGVLLFYTKNATKTSDKSVSDLSARLPLA